MDSNPDMKLRTARTLKWNVIDRVSSQVLYAVTGIVLARLLTPDDYGLVGAMMIFQAFATLFVDSGFSYALLQRKSPTDLDYSTVLWFNLAIATIIYMILWIASPLIAQIFQNDTRLILMSRVMFIVFIINASAIVQTNRLMKQMNVRMVAISNTAGLIAGAVIGITLAFKGYGAWAIVWQSIALSAIKSALLWLTSHWTPLLRFSWQSLRSIFKVGSAIMTSSFLNVLSQNIYSFFIGNRVSMVSLGYYTQADKWSKMGVASLSQVLTSSFLPVLSQFQDDSLRFARATAKMNRFTSYLLFPAMGFLILMSEPLFHILFGNKWDASIPLFQLLLLRGIFVVLGALYNNYILALGKSRLIVITEVIRDSAILIALIATLPVIAMTTPDDLTYGIRIMLWGQVIASGATFIVSMIIVARATQRPAWSFVSDSLPYLLLTAAIMAVASPLAYYIENSALLIATQSFATIGLYMGTNHVLRSRIQREAIEYITHRFRKRNNTGR